MQVLMQYSNTQEINLFLILGEYFILPVKH